MTVDTQNRRLHIKPHDQILHVHDTTGYTAVQQTELDHLRSILQLCAKTGLQILCNKKLA